MKILTRKKGGLQQSKLEKRITNISTPDLITWAENALYVIGKEVTHSVRSRDKALLEEALMGAEALTAIIKELMKRSEV